MIPLAKSVVIAASMLHECAINSHDERWQCLRLTNILLLGCEEVRSQDTHTLGWSVGAWYINKMLPSAVNTKMRVPV